MAELNSCSNLRRPLATQFNVNEMSTKNKSGLKRVYKLYDLIFHGICNVVGSGIYIMAGVSGKYDTGSSLLVSFIIGLFSASIAALSYAEFGSRLPMIGSAYSYTYVSSGEYIAFILGFCEIIVSIGAGAVNAKGASAYLKSFIETINIKNSNNLSNTVWFSNEKKMVSLNLVAPIIVLIFIIIVLTDIKLTSKVMNFFGAFNLTLLIIFIIAGFTHFNGDYMVNPCNIEYETKFESKCSDIDGVLNNSFFPFGVSGVFVGTGVTFWAYAGSEQICSVAEECVNPNRDIPRAIYITLLIVFILYELVTLSLFGMIPFHALNETSALASGFSFYNQIGLQRLCAFGAFTTMSIILFATLVGMPRLLYRMSKDGLLPKAISRINSKTKTPVIATSIVGIISIFLAMFIDLSAILIFSATQYVINYTLVITSLLILRYAPPNISDNTIHKVLNHKKFNISNIFALIYSYTIFSIIGSIIIAFKNSFNGFIALWYTLVIIIGIILIIEFGLILYLHYKLPWKTWIDKDILNKIVWVPLSPYTSLFVIPINAYIIATSGLFNLGIVLCLWIIGFIVYRSYGYKRSIIFTSQGSIDTIVNDSDNENNDSINETNAGQSSTLVNTSQVGLLESEMESPLKTDEIEIR